MYANRQAQPPVIGLTARILAARVAACMREKVLGIAGLHCEDLSREIAAICHCLLCTNLVFAVRMMCA